MNISSLKTKFRSFVAGYSAFMKKAEFAIEFCQSFLDWQDSFKAGSDERKKATQIAFLRLLVTLPEKKEDYLVSKPYMAGQYLFRTGLAKLTKDAKVATEKGTATEQQKRLASKPGRKSNKGKRNGKVLGVKVPLNTLLEVIANCDVTPKEFENALAETKIGKELARSLAESYSAILTRVAKAA